MGVSPGWGGTFRLVKLLGRSKALRVLGFAEPLTADEALNIGLVDQVVDDGQAIESAHQFLLPFLKNNSGFYELFKDVIPTTLIH